MEKVNLKYILGDYALYRKIKDKEENRVTAINYETCRQKLGEVMKVLGLNARYFKVNFVANQSFQFVEEDKSLLFEILDRFTSDEFVLIRQGEFLKVSLDVLDFYINAFTTILHHLDVDEEIINQQREAMIKFTCYNLVVEHDKARKMMMKIDKDIQKIFNFHNNLSYEDNINLMQYVVKQMQFIQDRIRHVYMNMDDQRFHDGFMGEANLIKQKSVEEKYRFKEKLIAQVELDQVLQKNTRYVELFEQMDKIINEQSFLKNKQLQLKDISKEMAEISYKIQMDLFGKIIHDDDLYDGQKISMKGSKEVLDEAIKGYEVLLHYRRNSDPDNPLIADISCDELFSGNE